MSGFCGWFGGGRVDDPHSLLDRMAQALPHYGPISADTATGRTHGLALHTHPAIGAFAAEPDILVAIEGYPEWSDEASREIARDQGHAKALAAAYKGKGLALLDLLHGAFSFALVDVTGGKLLCAIDRFGVQTLCYAQPTPGLTVFGSTTDAVRAHPIAKATISLQSLFDYLYFIDRVPAPSTIYREQHKLCPGEYLFVNGAQATVASYWHMPYRSVERIDKTKAARELRHRLRQSVETCLANEDGTRVGAFLSGGLDSSSVVGMAAESLHDSLQTFTIGFPVEDFDETHYAEIAAKHFATRHHTYYLRPDDIVDILPKAVSIYDEPFANSSVIPAYYCARLAKEAGVDMMLAGDGGDELFAGNKRYADDRVFDHYGKIPLALRSRMIEPVLETLSFARRAGLLGKAIRYVEHARKSVANRVSDNLFRALQPNEIFTADAIGEIDADAPLAMAEAIYDEPRDASKVQRMMQLDLRITLADSDLRKVTRMCELAGVRTRFPFLSESVAEFSAGIPETLLMEGGALRRFYKDALRNFLPEPIIEKKKHGFGLPYFAFMNSHGPLRALVCDSLTSLKGRRYFRNGFLETLIDHASRANLLPHEAAAWDLVVLELWLQSRGLA